MFHFFTFSQFVETKIWVWLEVIRNGIILVWEQWWLILIGLEMLRLATYIVFTTVLISFYSA